MTDKQEMVDRWYSTKEICAYLGISCDTNDVDIEEMVTIAVQSELEVAGYRRRKGCRFCKAKWSAVPTRQPLSVGTMYRKRGNIPPVQPKTKAVHRTAFVFGTMCSACAERDALYVRDDGFTL